MATGEPVLLLHGGFCSIETMRPQIADLALGYAVHAPERAGHGRTADHGEPFDYERMAEETVAYLDAVGLERVDILGFSDGAIIGDPAGTRSSRSGSLTDGHQRESDRVGLGLRASG